MKLILTFSDESIELAPEDIVIFGHKLQSVDDTEQFVDINTYKPDEKSISEYYDHFLKVHIPNVSSDFHNIIIGSNNNLYTNHLYLYKWVKAIDSVISENLITEIVITDTVECEDYAPYYEAEGEAHSRLFYRPYDFIPHILKKYIESKYKIKIQVIRNRSKFFLACRRFTRRYVLLLIKFVFYFIKTITQRTRNIEKHEEGIIDNIIVSRSIAHFDGVSLLHKKLPNSMLFCGESGFTYGDNYRFSSNNSDRVTSFSFYLRWYDVCLSLLFVMKSLLLRPKNMILSYKGIKYSYSDSMIEMIISYFEVDLLERAILKFIKKNNLTKSAVLYTCEMYTPFTKSLAEIGKRSGFKTVQLQTTNMFIMYEPNYIHCDYFVFNSQTLADSFSEKYPMKSKESIFIGNFMVPKPVVKLDFQPSALHNVLYFTQPLTDEDIEQEIIKELIRLGKVIGFKLKIKLHPRDNIGKVESYLNFIDVIDMNSQFDEYMEDVDLVVLKTSSIATKVVLGGVPIIYCLFSDWARNGNLDYIDNGYSGSLHTLEDIERCMKDLTLLNHSFENYRLKYIADNGLDSGVEDFIVNYKKILHHD